MERCPYCKRRFKYETVDTVDGFRIHTVVHEFKDTIVQGRRMRVVLGKCDMKVEVSG